MGRAFILVLDSLGIGAAPDAQRFGDQGANTLGHIAHWRARQGRPLDLPQLERLGLGAAMFEASGNWPEGWSRRAGFEAAYAAAAERSMGKDTPSGHWEMCGLPVDFEWSCFPREQPCFPAQFMSQWQQRCGLPGTLGNCHASGTEIIDRLGQQHCASAFPICYTSADSVFQVAAHEAVIEPGRLLEICRVAFELLQPYRIARVIARPFVGAPGGYRRTAGRRDFAVAPPGTTLLDVAAAQGREVIAIGKIGDIFSMRGITQLHKAADNMALFDQLAMQVEAAPEGALVFANFVDFDQNFGHRRDLPGYADALERFDARLPELLSRLRSEDLCIFTADHGCDPSQPGTDHSREFVPQLFAGAGQLGRNLGRRSSFCDLGQSVAGHLGLPALAHGTSVL